MSEDRRYKPTGRQGGSKTVYWFGFRLTDTAAQILFIFSIIGIICSLVGLIYLALSFVSILSAYSAMEQAASMGYAGVAATWGLSTIMYYVIAVVIDLVILGICIYTFNRCKQKR